MIHLKRVSEGNWFVCTQLNVTEEQKKAFPRRLYTGLLNPMKESLNCKSIMIGHRLENGIAGNLYESLGFQRVSEGLIDGEVVRLLRCK